MFHVRQDLAFGCPITLQLISDDDARDVLQPFEQLAEKSLRRFFVSSALHQDIQHVAILIHGSPEGMLLASNRENHLIHMPFVAATRTATTQFIRVGLPEFEAPLPNRFRGHDNPALCQKFFDRTENGARSGNTARQRD